VAPYTILVDTYAFNISIPFLGAPRARRRHDVDCNRRPLVAPNAYSRRYGRLGTRAKQNPRKSAMAKT